MATTEFQLKSTFIYS